VPGLNRRSIALLLGTVLVLWVVLIFGRAVATAADAAHQVQALEAANAARTEQLAGGARELQLVQTPAYLDLQARADGQGFVGETVFALASGAPPPRPIAALGSPTEPVAPSPVQAWLTLLFDH